MAKLCLRYDKQNNVSQSEDALHLKLNYYEITKNVLVDGILEIYMKKKNFHTYLDYMHYLINSKQLVHVCIMIILFIFQLY